MLAKPIATFSDLSESNFLTKAGAIVNGLRDNLRFPESWLAQVGTHQDLMAEFNTYQAAYLASANGDRIRIQERDAARTLLTARLQNLASYLKVVADGDVNKLMNTGYEPCREGGGAAIRILDAPTEFSVKHGKLSGSAMLHAACLPGRRQELRVAAQPRRSPRRKPLAPWQHLQR